MSEAIITPEMLEKLGASRNQLTLFRVLWPEGIVPTLEWADEYASEIDCDWAAANFLSPSALKEFDRITAPAREEFYSVTRPKWAEYRRIKARAFVRLWLREHNDE